MLGVVGFALLACGGLVCVGGYYAAEQGQQRQAELDRAAAAKLPWMATFDATCKRYRAASSEADRKRMNQEQEALIRRTTIPLTNGTLEKKRMSEDGSSMDITIGVGSAKFQTGLLNELETGTSSQLVVDKIPEGSCIRFSARSLTIASLLEGSRTCDKDFIADFATIEPCP